MRTEPEPGAVVTEYHIASPVPGEHTLGTVEKYVGPYMLTIQRLMGLDGSVFIRRVWQELGRG